MTSRTDSCPDKVTALTCSSGELPRTKRAEAIGTEGVRLYRASSSVMLHGGTTWMRLKLYTGHRPRSLQGSVRATADRAGMRTGPAGPFVRRHREWITGSWSLRRRRAPR
ncbi:hypothetical protein Sfulv_17210 [Streptomyces fulvorobeus]|uniref:Uncharacterized protein n=1 Tax=Streptomyces fulvorobeus TaxID=284028 RepID=A0A7J0C350_9ACTN|nr:hypothetical protein Sfulv_17210 [Streptomyces fulvorobeus]